MNPDNNALITLTQARARVISDAVNANKVAQALQTLLALDPADVAGVFNELSPDIREQFVDIAMRSLDPEFLLDLEEDVREQLLSKITTVSLAKALTHMDTKDALLLMDDMSLEQRKSLLSSLSPETRSLIEVGLTYPLDSAGRIANTRPLALPGTLTVQNARTILGSWKSETSYIILLDKYSKPQFSLHIAQLAANTIKQDLHLEDLHKEEVYCIRYDLDQEDAAFLFRRYKLKLAAIVNDSGKLLGALDAESILQVEHDEAEEDLMKLTGSSEADSSASRFVFIRAWARIKWLFVTICLAIFSTAIANSFSDMWRAYPEFLLIYPMIAAICGAGLNQIVGMTIRALSNRQLSVVNIGKNILREMNVSALTGIFLGIVIALRCSWFSNHTQIVPSIIAGSSLTLAMLCASVLGVAIPFLSHRLGLDPAASVGAMLSVMDIITSLLLFGLARYFLG